MSSALPADAPHSDSWRPLVSVVIEGYNEVQLATSATETLDALARQEYPTERIELILVGSDEQHRDWTALAGRELGFHRIVTVPADGLPYYALKNRGAGLAQGEIIAFVDSDVLPAPGWVPAIVGAIARGADVTAGLSGFRHRDGRRWPRALLEPAASVAWGHVVGGADRAGDGAGGANAHNLGGRAELIRATPFRVDELGRNTGIGRFFSDCRAAGARVVFVPEQRVAHSFSLRWFAGSFTIRVGWEEQLRRHLDPRTPLRRLMRFGPLEPVLVGIGSALHDHRVWPSFSRARGLTRAQTLRLWPVLWLTSGLARVLGMIGAYAAMLAPRASRAWAERQ